MEVVAGRQQKWERGLVFVRSSESQLAQRGESLGDGCTRWPIATVLEDLLTNRVFAFFPHASAIPAS